MKAVAIGGGHGTAVSLRALRRLTPDVTGVVSVADNGGSTGRLREMLDVAAVGDLRKCLVALADPTNALAPRMEHRFSAGDLEGHALGNLILAGLIDATGNLEESVREVGDLLHISGRVLPASTQGVTLVAHTDEGRTEGQIEVAAAGGIRRLTTVPRTVGAPASACDAIAAADLIVIGPGSLYTSVLAACIVPGISDALARGRARIVLVANLRDQSPETAGYSLVDHINAVRRHGIPFDVVLSQRDGVLGGSDGSFVVALEDLAGHNGLVHDEEKLARSLCGLVA
jgi:uncharacterized cofD-like protein